MHTLDQNQTALRRAEAIASHLAPTVNGQGSNPLSFEALSAPALLPNDASQKGKKHDNSLKLKQFVSEKPGTLLKRFVPHFEGVRDDYLKQEARHQKPLAMQAIEQKWKQLAELYAAKKEGFFTDPGVLRLFAEIEQLITNDLFPEGGPIPLPADNLILIGNARAKGIQLIVRSSGDEDGDGSKGSQVAPGIHESVPAVAADPNQVRKAMGIVIASYMSVKAMQAKAIDRDNPFSTIPPWSVKIQEFVGETAEEIPVSIVLATNETLYVEGKEERVTTLNAAVGFGDGVTSGLVAPDAAILVSKKDGSGITSYYENRDKPLRIRASNASVAAVKNSDMAQKTRALSDEQLSELYELAKELEAHFGYPVDAELVIRGNNVYLVQARPLVREKQVATYFDPDLSKVKGHVPFFSAIPNLAQVSSVTDPTKVLVANTLENALKDYKPGVHTHIAVQEMPGEYSHAALFFAALKPPIPVFQLDIQAFNKLKKGTSETSPLLFDVQQGKVYALKGGVDQTRMRQGWINHPTGRKLSLDLPENRLPRITQPSLLPDHAQANLEKLGSANREEANEALLDLGKYCFEEITSLDLGGHDAAFYQSVAESTQDVWVRLFKNLDQAINDPSIPHLERLLHVKMLERSLTQRRTSEDDKSLSAYSIPSLRSEIALDQPATDYMERVPQGTLAREANLSRYALTLVGKELYISFLEEIESDPRKEEFQEMVATMERLGAAPLWINFFLSERAKGADLSKILSAFGSTERELAEKLFALGKRVEQTRSAVAGSTTVKVMDEHWSSVQEVFRTLEDEKQSYRSLSPIGKALVLQMLHKTVDLADIAIKVSKTLPYPNDEEAAIAMKAKVGSFGKVVQAWGAQLLDNRVYTNRGGSILFEDYCQRLLGTLRTLPNTKASTLPSPGYDARAQMWGSDNIIAQRGQWAASAEDVFTTFHQTMLVCFERAGAAMAAEESSLTMPLSVLDIKNRLEARYQGNQYLLRHLGTVSNEHGLSIHYQLPLRSHGMGCVIEYDRRTGKTTFAATLYGQTRERAPLMQSCIELTNLTQDRTVVDPPRVEAQAGLFHAKWEVRNAQEAESLIDEFKLMEELSFSYNPSRFTQIWEREIENAPPRVAKERVLELLEQFIESPISLFLPEKLSIWLKAHQTDSDYAGFAEKIEEATALSFKNYLFSEHRDQFIDEKIMQLLPENKYLQNLIAERIKNSVNSKNFSSRIDDWLEMLNKTCPKICEKTLEQFFPTLTGHLSSQDKKVREFSTQLLVGTWEIVIGNAPPAVAKDRVLSLLKQFIGSPTIGPLSEKLSTWLAAHNTDPDCASFAEKMEEAVALSFKDYLFSEHRDQFIDEKIMQLLPENKYLQNLIAERIKNSVNSKKAYSIIEYLLEIFEEAHPKGLEQLFPFLKEKLSSQDSEVRKTASHCLISFYAGQIHENELIGQILGSLQFDFVKRTIKGLTILIKGNGSLAALLPLVQNLSSKESGLPKASGNALMALFGAEIQNEEILGGLLDSVENEYIYGRFIESLITLVRANAGFQNNLELAQKVADLKPYYELCRSEILTADHLDLTYWFRYLDLMAALPDIQGARAKVSTQIDIINQRLHSQTPLEIKDWSGLRKPEIQKQIRETLAILKQRGYDLTKIAKAEAFIDGLAPQAGP